MSSGLTGLTAYKQFIVYKVVPSASRPGKTDKFPCDYLTGKVADAHNPAIWTDSATAQATASQWGEGWGVGFVFTEGDPFFFLDIDGCLVDGAWSPLAQQLCSLFAGCCIEISQSGTGLHIFGTGRPPAHGCRNIPLGLEFYHAGRFVALTGIGVVGDCLTDAGAVLPTFVATYFPADIAAGDVSWSEGPVAEWNGPTDDGELLRRAMNSKSAASAFGTRASFADLWLANESVLAAAYPDPNGRSYDASAADAALAQHLAFWTGSDCERIERMMRQSGLVRPKWDDHKSYLGELTILSAVSRQTEWLQDARAVPPPPPDGSVPTASAERGGDGFCSLDQQRAHFAGCVYVRSHHRVLVPDGTLMRPESFKVRYGGLMFPLDADNTKSTRDAWEAWTQSQVLRCVQVETTCFNPQLPFGQIVTEDKLDFVNTYMPMDIRTVAGDPTPFLTHLAKLLPIERDRNILLAYLAACVQHKGIKFQWAPLIQGVEGNGKTLLSRCVDYAIGSRYTQWPSGETLVSKFNAWLEEKIFIAVEDVHIPESRHHLMDVLKPLITNTEITIEGKGLAHKRSSICANFVFNTNHKGALPKTDNERRITPFFTAQQSVDDLKRDGMGGDYFPNLYEWCRADGYAIVAHYLQSYAIPAAMDPTRGSQRAPQSSSHDDAVEASKGFVEQEISEAIEQGVPGFAGGWISSVMMDRYLEQRGMARRISPHKRKQILEAMGYRYHPALTDGRTNNNVLPDATKPRLYVKLDSLAAQITNPAVVAKEYETSNNTNIRAFQAFGVARG